MSGPKISKYTLAPRERALLNAQNECDNNILKCIERIKSMEKQIAVLANNIIMHDNYGSNENIELATTLKEKIKEIGKSKNMLSDRFRAFSGYRRSSRITLSEKELQRKNRILEKADSIKDEVSILLDEAKECEKQWLKLKAQILVDIQDDLNTAFNLSWDTFEKDVVSTAKDDIVLVLSDMLSNSELSTVLKTKVQNAIEKAININQDDFLRNFNVVTVKPLVDECQAYIKNIETYGAEFRELEAEYKIFCSDMHIIPKTFEVSKIGITKLKTEIIMLKEDVLKSREQEYIADAIDDVMKEMGYDLIGSREVSKKNGTRFRDELYTFGEGTAVNVRYDSHGRIAVELGGVDNTDRLPSSSEALKLEDEMVAFCDEFTEFERKLEAKGIISKDRISHLPPKAEYAQIINVSDYRMIANAKTNIKRRTVKSEKTIEKG